MKRDLSPTAPTPAIAAALRRRPAVRAKVMTGGEKEAPPLELMKNNCVAAADLTHGPNSGNRLGAGARRGNCNALRTGAHTAVARADRARWWRLFAELDSALAAVVAAHHAKIDASPALLRVDAVVQKACAR